MGSSSFHSIGVIGAGAWGTALAHRQAAEGRDCKIWAREEEVVQSINAKHENELFMPGIKLDEKLVATSDMAEVLAQDILLMVTPAQYMRASLEDLKPLLEKEEKPIVICSKGIEISTGKLLLDVALEVLGSKYPVAILTGPTFASEIAQNKPSAITIAAKDQQLLKTLMMSLGCRLFRPYVSTDIIGVQLGSAIKNVIAIASGIVSGRELGDSARAALITRGLAEMSRLCVAMGGKRETLMGMCGVGDLLLTSTSMQSRNYSLGMRLGQGESLEEILGSRNSVSEGVYTAEATLKVAKKNAVDMPITNAVHDCLSGKIDIDEAIEQMLNRPFKY